MPRMWIVVPLLMVFFTAAGIGGFFLLRPAQGPPRQREPIPEVPPAPAATDEQPKLVVLLVFDQMRGDYVTRFADVFGPDGFERIKKEGVWFSECRIPYACTSTGPGHASLATGAPPSVHGIVENEWFDRRTNTKFYCCQPGRKFDLVPPLLAEDKDPNRGSALGFSPERLLVPTVSDHLREHTGGKGRTFSLSIKDRTAVLMGGQRPSGVYCFDTRDGRFHTGAFYGRDAEHPWVKEFNESKFVDSWFDITWERLLPEPEYAKRCGPDDAAGEAQGFNGQGRAFPHSLKGKLDKPAKKYYDALEGSPFGNELLVALAKKAITAEKLGQGTHPDLLCVSFSSNDLIGHRWGPDSHEMMDVTVRSDRMVGQFLAFLDESVGKGKYVLVVASDHGVCPLPEAKTFPTAARVMLKDVEAALSTALDAEYGVKPGANLPWFAMFDADLWPWVYLNADTLTVRELDREAVSAFVAGWLAKQPHIQAAYTRKQLAEGDDRTDRFKEKVRLAYHPDRCGDVIAVPKEGVLVTTYAGGTSHGSPQPYDAHVPFLLYGAGVPALGKWAEPVSSLAVAPTVARALGLPELKHAAVRSPLAK
jgi:hypothetical protein